MDFLKIGQLVTGWAY